jgi:nucleolar protein 14
MRQENRENLFRDRRFGENDQSMTVEEKMLQRFVTEKKSRFEKSSLFSLGNDGEEELTHFGQSLSSMTDLADHDPRLDSDSDDLDQHAGIPSILSIFDYCFLIL